MGRFLKEEEGNVTVAFSLLIPFILFYMLWTVSTWQASYVQLQTKEVIDIALLGGSTSGIAQKISDGSQPSSCYIPVKGGSDDVVEYGADIATDLLYDNAYATLPKSVADQLMDKADGYWDDDDEKSVQLGGYMHFKAKNISYRSIVPGFPDWQFTIESSARCIPR